MSVQEASPEDFDKCLDLLRHRDGGRSSKATKAGLYLEDQKLGFTLITTENEGKQVTGISTFSKRTIEPMDGVKQHSLYWENLYVHSYYRDGAAYIKIFAYLRRLIKRKEISDIYFIVHRPQALKLHQKVGFKRIAPFYLCVKFSDITLKFSDKVIDPSIAAVCDFNDFGKTLRTLSLDLQKDFLSSLETSSELNTDNIIRQLAGKRGLCLFANKGRRLLFVRVYKLFFGMHFYLPTSTALTTSDRLVIKSVLPSGINIGIRFCRGSYDQKKPMFILRTYHLLSYLGVVSSDRFNLLEHDAF